MLEAIDEIPWAELGHAFGHADDVPRLLRDLLSGDAGSAVRAIGKLRGNIWHQGTIYEATASAVPFLILSFRSPGPVRAEVGHLLGAIARASVFTGHPGRFPAQMRAWMTHAHDAVSAGFETYLEVLREPSEGTAVRLAAAYACGGCRAHADRVVASLLADVVAEEDGRVQSALLLAIDELIPDEVPETVVDAFREIASTSGERAARGMAVVTLLRADRSISDLDAAGSLAAAITEYAWQPWYDDGDYRLMSLAARSAPTDRRADVIREMASSPEPELRRQAVSFGQATAERWRAPTPGIAGALAPLVMDEDDEVRLSAIGTLTNFGESAGLCADAFAAAVDRAPGDFRVLGALAKLRDGRAIGPILDMLRGEDRVGQGFVLGSVGPFAPEVLPILVEQVRTEPEADPIQGPRLQAIGRFGALGIEHGADRVCREIVARGGRLAGDAVSALGSMGPGASHALGVIQEMVGSSDSYPKLYAITALWRISRDPALVVGPLTAFAKDQWIDTRVCDLLIEIGEPMAELAPILRQKVEQPQFAHIATHFVEAIAAVDPSQADSYVPRVIARLGRGGRDEAGLRVLARGGEEAVDALDLLRADVESPSRVVVQEGEDVIERDEAWVRACRQTIDAITGIG